MKKITAWLMAFFMMFGLVACSSSPSVPSESETVDSSAPVSSEEESSPSDEEDLMEEETDIGNTDVVENENTLVVYFSATGNTKEVAGYIAEAAGADLFELEPEEPYTSADLDWTDENSRVLSEHDNPDAQNVELVTNTVDDWASYDTVFVGFPIWLAYHNLIQCTQA